MKVMIAGGSGLVGRALTQELLDNGHTVYVLTRHPQKNEDSLPERVHLVAWDGKSTEGWEGYVNEVDAIVNLAGAPLNGRGPFDIWLTNERKEQLINSRLDTTNALIEGIREAEKRPTVYVQASAIGYYGPSGDEKIHEDSEAGDDYLAWVQVQTERASAEVKALGLRRVVIRTGLVLDEDEGAFQYFKLQFALFAGGRMGSGEQYYSWIHIEDEAAAIRLLLGREDASGVYNLTSPNPVKNKEFAKVLGQVMKRPSFFVIPAFLLRMVLGEISTVVLDGQRVMPKRLTELGFEFKYPDLREALKDVA